MIPEDAVEAAVRAAKVSFDGKPPRGMRLAIRLALEAAAPHMLAGAFEGGFQKGVEFQEWAGHLDDHKPDFTNPYRTTK